MQVTLFIHIIGGAVGLLSGAVALYAFKGARVHRKSGMVFVWAMLTMSLSGAVIAALTSVETSVVAGLLTAYLVTTALTTLQSPSVTVRRINIAAAAVALLLFAGSYAIAAPLAVQGVMERDGMPVPALLTFGAVALGGALSDLRLIRSGVPVTGSSRLTRHLWRMCFALFIASASFFLGQSQIIPEPFRVFPILIAIAFGPLVFMGYWLWRVRVRKGSIYIATSEPGSESGRKSRLSP